MHISSSINKNLHDFQVALVSCNMQWCILWKEQWPSNFYHPYTSHKTVIRDHFSVFSFRKSTSVKQGFNNFIMPMFSCQMERSYLYLGNQRCEMWQLCKDKYYELLLFLRSDAAGTIFLLLIFVQLLFLGSLLFEGSVYFFWKPADINDGWIKYVWAIQWQLLNAITSTHSLTYSPAVSLGNELYNKNSPRASPLTDSHTCMCAAYTSRDYYSRAGSVYTFCSELPIVWLLFEGIV